MTFIEKLERENFAIYWKINFYFYLTPPLVTNIATKISPMSWKYRYYDFTLYWHQLMFSSCLGVASSSTSLQLP